MARVAFPLVLQSPLSGSALVGATATVTQHVVGGVLGSGAASTIYTSEAGAGTVGGNQIVTDSNGRFTQGAGASFAQYWLAQNTYDIAISGTGLTTYTITRELFSGGLADEVNLAGELKMWAGAAAPSGFLLCDGTAYSRSTYAILFAAISTAYGAGDGSTTFNVPNMLGRFPLGKAASGTGAVLGGTGGALGHTHTLPSHYHSLGNLFATIPNHTHTFNNALSYVPVAAGWGTQSVINGGNVFTTPQTVGGGFGQVSATDATGITVPNASFGGNVGLVGSTNSGDTVLGSGAADPAFQTVNYVIRHGNQ